MYEAIYQESLKRAKHKVWVLSDLQQSDPALARECMDVCMADFAALGRPADMIWYLGDAVEGSNRTHLDDMCRMQEEAFGRTGLPLCYTPGNHDFDYVRNTGEYYLPFYETVKAHKGWHTSETLQDTYFRVECGPFAVYFFTDHTAADFAWHTTHGVIHGNKEAYPHNWERFREVLATETRPILTASHYAFAGGNRASDLLSRLLPLPQSVKLHLYGHAHIGDFDWAGQDAWRRIAWVDWHDIPQINVSSFEHVRGQTCRSVFLHIYEDESFGIFFRNHDAGVFSECYFPAKTNYPPKP